MIREQMINFLQTVVVFLLLTNALTAIAATYAMRIASAVTVPVRVKGAVERGLDGLLGGVR